MSALPIRIRLTLPFALAMALVLAAAGTFVYTRVGTTLMRSTDQTLATQASEATLRLQNRKPLVDRDATAGANISQVIAPNGRVTTSAPIGFPALLTPARIHVVLAGHLLRETVSSTGQSGRWRLLAIREHVGAGNEVLVLASSLRDRDESLERLRHELLISLPLALLVATIAGYILAGAALHPVEAMRRKAAAISAATPDSRLPVPRATDEVSRLALTLNEMLARLETAFEHERRFIAEASHELRTPLALLRTELDLALRKPRSREDLEEALRSAAEETDRLTALAADLLVIADSENRATPVRLERVEVRELLDDVAERFAARAGELGRTVRVRPDADGLHVDADPKRVEQALGNLVDNALLHGSGTVTLWLRRASDQLEFHVSDEGVGFPADFAARAFDRFSRADEARRRSGSGLGLAIVRSIAIAHRGGVGVGTPESGADVWFSLTASAPRAERAGRAARRGEAPAAGLEGAGQPYAEVHRTPRGRR